MIEAVEERQRVLDPAADVRPADAGLRSGRQLGSAVHDREWRGRFRHCGPPLIHEWNAARRESRDPDHFNRVARDLRRRSYAGHREELVVHDVQEIAWSETIGRRDDVGLAPADELLADVN